MSHWIDGAALAAQIRQEVAGEVGRLRRLGVQPGLAVVLVGENPASQVYVRGKVRTCEALGMHSEKIELPASATTEEVISVVEALNRRDEIHGFLIQLPLPPEIDARRVLDSISPAKDVDGIHPINAGRLVAGNAEMIPCTPAGIMEVFRRCHIQLNGKRAVVLGRSQIVGKPLALLLMQADATVTVCHSKTTDLRALSREAEILVVAIGRPAFVDDSFLKPGAVVIDVGVNRVDSLERIREIFGNDARREEDFRSKGYTLVGDVHPRLAFSKASQMTPVPGGVGPLTIAMLMVNTVRAAASRLQRPAGNL